MTAIRLVLALVLIAAAPCMAFAQDQAPAQDQPQDQPAADPVEALLGLWRVDQVEGKAANDAMKGSMLRIDRQAIVTLTGGTCAGPGFKAAQDPAAPRIDVLCLGQVLASATWNASAPDTVTWSEPDLQAVLHRVASAAALKAATGAGDAQ